MDGIRVGPTAALMPHPGAYPPPMMQGYGKRMRLPATPAQIAQSCIRNRLPTLLPVPANFPAFPGDMGPPQHPQGLSVGLPSPGIVFTQEDIDMVLYGYARIRGNRQIPGHALSGLRIGELSYGIDRILAGCSTIKHPVAAVHVDPATLDVPEGFEVFQTTFAGTVHSGVFCNLELLQKGTRFGPFKGKQVNTSEIKSNDDNSFMWEVFHNGKLSHFVDGRGNSGNWMAFVNCARYAQEQNLIAVQTNDQIYYETCKDITRGTELLVWYGDCYLQFMGIPVALKETAGAPFVDTEEETGADGGDVSASLNASDGYQCERCGKVFAYRYYRDKHLKYTRCVDQGDRKFPCHLCSRSFEKRDRLRIHILHVHEKHRPHKCSVCGKSFSQSSSLNKHMRVHSGERPYKCVYCNKAFTASSILRTHIRQHSGEKPFKCKYCGKAFASHAAHDSHVRRTHARDKPVTCHVCGESFGQAYDLKFHLKIHDTDGKCGNNIAHLAKFLSENMSRHEKIMDESIDVVGGVEQSGLSAVLV